MPVACIVGIVILGVIGYVVCATVAYYVLEPRHDDEAILFGTVLWPLALVVYFLYCMCWPVRKVRDFFQRQKELQMSVKVFRAFTDGWSIKDRMKCIAYEAARETVQEHVIIADVLARLSALEQKKKKVKK